MHWLHWFCFLSHFTSPNLHFAGSKSRDVFLHHLHIWHKLGIQTEVEDETSCCLVCCCYHYYYHLCIKKSNIQVQNVENLLDVTKLKKLFNFINYSRVSNSRAITHFFSRWFSLAHALIGYLTIFEILLCREKELCILKN